MDRRTLLKGLAACSGSLMLAGCAPKRASRVAAPAAPERRDLAKVIVSPGREIRTTVCLRPFRASGFRLVAEKLDDKLCIHNYGHGGAGITLSWGTAQLAMDEVHASGRQRVAVLGCGVVGLATARLAQQSGKDVTIYAKALPPDTTSNSAGGLWKVYSVADHDRQTPQFNDQLLRSARFSYTYFQQFAGDDYGVHWMRTYQVENEPFWDSRPAAPRITFPDSFPDLHNMPPGDHPFPRHYVQQYRTMLIEPNTYLRALLRDFHLAGGKLVLQEFHQVSELARLPEPVVVNCTGLGARALFDDSELIPIKGQLTYLLPQPEVDYVVMSSELYMFPRADGIVLGGTHARGDWSLDPDLAAKERVLAGHARLFSEL